MKHKQIEEKLILYLDGVLSGREMSTFQEHLEHCSNCRKKLDLLAGVWRAEAAVKRENPSPFLWTRLEARIDQYERNKNLFTDFFEQLVRLARPAVTLSMLVGGILLGVYLGNIPVSRNTQRADLKSSAQERERFFNSIYLDSFQDFPRESVGGVYVTLASNKNGGTP